ncbi:hypothetical protein D3C81_1410850 [compost metagenome]
MRRGDIDQPGAIGNLLHAQAFGIHRHAREAGALGHEQQACRRVAGVFHGNLATALDQYPRHQVQRLLGTVADQHGVGRTPHATGERDMPGNGFAQFGQALGQAVEALRTAALAQGMGDAAAPFVKGEVVLDGRSTDEIVAQGAEHGRGTQGHLHVAPQADHRGTGQARFLDRCRWVAAAGVDEGAAAHFADQQIVVRQARIGVGHGLARHAQLLGQQSRGRQL